MKVLILSPLYDLASAIGTRSALKLQNYCLRNNINHKLAFMGECLRLPFEINMASDKYDLVTYFGHGEKEKWYGQHLIMAMLDQNNSHIMKDTIIYAMSCHTACIIGPDTILKGAKAYFGDTDYYYGAFPNFDGSYDYLTDWLDYVTIIPKSLIEGKTTLQSIELYNQKINYYLEKYENDQPKNWDFYYKTMTSNRDKFRLLGDKFTRLRK